MPNSASSVGGRQQAGDGLAVAHGLAQGDDVGHEAVALEAPHMLAGAAEAGLHLVGDEQAAGGADRLDRAGFRKPAGSGKTPSLEKMRVDQQRRRA